MTPSFTHTYTLEITFLNVKGEKVVMNFNSPKTNLTFAQIEAAFADIISTGNWKSSSNDVIRLVLSARVIEQAQWKETLE